MLSLASLVLTGGHGTALAVDWGTETSTSSRASWLGMDGSFPAAAPANCCGRQDAGDMMPHVVRMQFSTSAPTSQAKPTDGCRQAGCHATKPAVLHPLFSRPSSPPLSSCFFLGPPLSPAPLTHRGEMMAAAGPRCPCTTKRLISLLVHRLATRGKHP